MDVPDLAAMRQEYSRVGLAEADLAADWLTQFESWLAAVTALGLPEPNAMVVASADSSGRPSARTVLLKDVDASGFVFYTNYESRKARELSINPYASLVFPWHALGRQVRASGTVSRVERAETEAYWATRPRESQLGAWASAQSQVVADRPTLDEAYERTLRRFGDGEIPAPPHWGGYRIDPDTVEFWQGRTGRLHDRLQYRRTDDGWIVERLNP
jgi:pyridoxamine 5'-phosphate oxidase